MTRIQVHKLCWESILQGTPQGKRQSRIWSYIKSIFGLIHRETLLDYQQLVYFYHHTSGSHWLRAAVGIGTSLVSPPFSRRQFSSEGKPMRCSSWQDQTKSTVQRLKVCSLTASTQHLVVMKVQFSVEEYKCLKHVPELKFRLYPLEIVRGRLTFCALHL